MNSPLGLPGNNSDGNHFPELSIRSVRSQKTPTDAPSPTAGETPSPVPPPAATPKPKKRQGPDPLAALAQLEGVAEAAEAASDAIAAVHRHRANLRGWDVTGAESVLRGARASAKLDGGSIEIPEDGNVTDPILAGAIRAGSAIDPQGIRETSQTWQRAPLQVLAKLNSLAAPRLNGTEPGRPDPSADQRLHLLAKLVTGATSVGAAVLSGVVHGEIMALSPFGEANGVTARAASRLVTITGGLDPRGLGVPEVYWSRNVDRYAYEVECFSSGTAEGLRSWLLFHIEGLRRGATEAASIAEAK